MRLSDFQDCRLFHSLQSPIGHLFGLSCRLHIVWPFDCLHWHPCTSRLACRIANGSPDIGERRRTTLPDDSNRRLNLLHNRKFLQVRLRQNNDRIRVFSAIP